MKLHLKPSLANGWNVLHNTGQVFHISLQLVPNKMLAKS